MEEKQISFKVIKSGTNITDLRICDSYNYIKLPNLTLLTYKSGSKELYSSFLAGVHSDGCDCCASYYKTDMFKDVVKWEILEIS